MNGWDLILPGLGSLPGLNGKGKKKKQEREEEQAAAEAKIQQLENQHKQNFGQPHPFQAEESILEILMENAALVKKIKQQYEILIKAQNGAQLVPYDRLNLAIIMLNNLQKTNPSLQAEISTYAQVRNLNPQALNRTIAAWLRG